MTIMAKNGESNRSRISDLAVVEVQHILITEIEVEEGLGRLRDREGHEELQRSIEQFGVLTPVTVRRSHLSGKYLLVKGQGRTLACRLIGLSTVPAIVVGDDFADHEKVQQFLVENVARLKMRPVDRALLIHRARVDGEETVAIARRFGLTPTSVRRLLAQLEGVSSREVAVLRSGNVSLTMHAMSARYALPSERAAILEVLAQLSLKPGEVEALFLSLGWKNLNAMGAGHVRQRLTLFAWACHTLNSLPPGPIRERLSAIAMRLPLALDHLTSEGHEGHREAN